ncbi:hypothetical protein PSECIP111854_01866 [Pseudoalteromonas sp. CIP111854]|uniref:Fimbrial assembly protein n=1 Tax=Pseudoalteromonas holothuriae TaxID=2963714 RepID=A0A9W4QX48_9GAMM|nr:hypothetical protein [Pseudoalteromonas sp. CIP111854]CAH9056799.1 hypothetical protein PSECIP111854_01866 [Pseudoalteromonas sp. CIP111854]
MSIKSLSRLFQALALPNVGYYDGNLYRFERKEGKLSFISAKDSFAPKLIIVNRKYYKEAIKTLPFDDKRQFDKLLDLEKAEDSSLSALLINRRSGSTHYVEWRISTCVPNSFFIVPETILLTQLAEPRQVIKINGDQPVFAFACDEGVYSSKQSALISNEARFLQSIGYQFQGDIKVIEEEKLAYSLFQGAMKLPLLKWKAFFKGLKSDTGINLSVKLLLPMSIAFIVYLLLSSLFLQWQNTDLRSKIEAYQSEVSEALALQSEVDTLEQRYRGMISLSGELSEHNQFWLVLVDILPKTNLTNIRVGKTGRYVLRGNASKSTEILTLLLEHSMVAEAQFDYPTRKSRDREIFVISFTLKQGGE